MKFHPNSILTVDDIRDVEEAVLNAVINGYELEDISLGEMVDSGVEFKFDIDDLETFDLGLIDKAFERVFFLYTEAKTYEVGGAVRDRLMGRVAKDTDYCVVGATPEKMLKHGFVQVGAAFPVFLHPATRDEYALARRERKTGDGYHGFEVEFDPSACGCLNPELRDKFIALGFNTDDDYSISDLMAAARRIGL